jgi:signal transduction histidine kinase/CheY-like chemotaxis protein
MTIGLDHASLSRLFPCHMIVDRQLTLLSIGDVLAAAPDGPVPGAYLLDYFRWPGADPVGDFARLAQSAEFVRLACSKDRALFDGMIVPVEQGYLLAMNMVPAAFALERAVMQMSDFGVADTMVSGMLLVGMQRALLEESRQIAKELTAERERNLYLIERGRRFAGYTAHDFNNMLSIISLNSARIAQSETLAEETRRRIAIIQETASRGAEIASSLMTLANQKHDSPQMVDVDALLAEQQGYLAHIAGSMIALRMDLQAGKARVMAATSGLLNSVINLVLNARQAMPEGGTIDIATALVAPADQSCRSAQCPPAGCVILTVRDSGCGMSDAVMRQAFEPFFSTKPHGSGMGLASVREFAREFGGDVQCRSQIGAGARFDICLPVIDETEMSQTAPAAAAGQTGNAPAGAALSVLLVEDEPYARDALDEMLSVSGFAVTSAETFAEGKAHIDRQRFDILLTDVRLHDDSGIDLAALAWRTHQAERVILMSGYVPDADALDQAWSFVRKPVDVDKLCRMMREPA